MSKLSPTKNSFTSLSNSPNSIEIPSGKNAEGKYIKVNIQLALHVQFFLFLIAVATIMGTGVKQTLKITLKIKSKLKNRMKPFLLSQNKKILHVPSW